MCIYLSEAPASETTTTYLKNNLKPEAISAGTTKVLDQYLLSAGITNKEPKNFACILAHGAHRQTLGLAELRASILATVGFPRSYR